MPTAGSRLLEFAQESGRHPHSLRFTRIIFAALLSTALITIISLGGFNRAWADESQADEPYESPFVPVSVPFNSSASTMIDPSDVLQSNRCFTFTVPQDMKVHVEMDYLLPCYHGGYLITIVDSKGQELFNDFTPRLIGEMQEYGESYFTKELKKGDYHVEVIYTQSHKTQWGWFSVGVYDDSAYTALHATPLWCTQITMPKTAVSYTGKMCA